MQGVYIQKNVAGLEELKALVKSHKNGVFLKSEKGLVRVLTRQQKKEYLDKENMIRRVFQTGFPLEWPQPGSSSSSSEPIIVLEEIQAGRPSEAGDEKAEWLINWFTCWIRPKSKRELQQQVAQDPSGVYLEATSDYGNDYDGALPEGPFKSYNVVGPDPKRKRSWFAKILWSEKKNAWIVE